MASYGSIKRSSTWAEQPLDDRESRAPPTQKSGSETKLVFAFNLPSTQEAVAHRIIKNIGTFGLYYLQFVYIVLFIALIPERKVSLVFLVGMREIASLYLLLLSALPNNSFLLKIIDKRFVFFSLSIITGVQMILTRAVVHLSVTLASTAPIVLAHAALWKPREDPNLVMNEDQYAIAAEAGDQLLPIAQNISVGDVAESRISLEFRAL